MSYVPPHKRQSKDPDSPFVRPEPYISPYENKNLHKRPFGYNNEERLKGQQFEPVIEYAENAVSTWFSVGLGDDDDSQFSRSVRLEQHSLKYYQQKKSREQTLILMLNDRRLLQTKGDGDGGDSTICPVRYIVSRVEKDLISSFQNVRMLMEQCSEVKPSMVIRFGRVIFNESSSLTWRTLVTEAILKGQSKTFYTNLPPSYLKFVEDEAVDKIGFKFEAEKKIYNVKLIDRLRDMSIISCKCRTVKNSNKIEIYKMELNQLRHFVGDISCLGQKRDARIMLYSKRNVTTDISEEEKKKIEYIISFAVLDPDIKDGLKLSLGKQSDEDRFSIVEVWPCKSKSFRYSSMRLLIRKEGRFVFETSTGDGSGEVVLKMSKLALCLKDNKFGDNVVPKLLNDGLKVIWDILLSSFVVKAVDYI